MRPEKGKDTIQIPITFDSRSGVSRSTASSKWLWSALITLFWLISAIFVALISETLWRFFYPVLSFILTTYIIRFLVVREKYFKKKRQELIDNEYMFSHAVFWGIHEISAKYPYIAKYGNNIKAIFVALDKDVIVGKDDDYDYTHHEAIAEAYQQMEKKGIECIHIDYMDTLGKDDRLEGLFKSTETIKNPDLRNVMLRMYDHIEYTMTKSYASYDVYCFYSNKRDDIFWEELQGILAYFKLANYLRARPLNKDAIATLVESVINMDNFSVSRASDTIFKELNSRKYLKPIWVEVNGERTILNKTSEEIKETERVRQSERKLKKKGIGSKVALRKNKNKVEDDIDLFD